MRIIVLILFFLVKGSWADESSHRYKSWPTEFFSHLSYDIGQEFDDTSVKLSYAIFDCVDRQSGRDK